MDRYQEPLGIPDTGINYMKFKPGYVTLQDKVEEFVKITDFLIDVANSNTIPEFQGNNKRLQFINYGDTELVYVLSVGTRKYTLLVGQPATEFGTVRKEYENLKAVGKKHKKNVVVPMQYFKDKEGKRELFVTPYLYQARCVGIETRDWGEWVPEPDYYFREFSNEERKVINSSMIAMLINFFDAKSNLGIGSCKLGGGDFVLEKGYENEELTHENILRRMKLIAARELVSMSLEEYVRRIREEFSKRTYYRNELERDKSVLINHKLKVPMSQEEIEEGVELGLKLREQQREQEQK